ncbi:ParB/RepB/Spo0J family partition protein [Nocardia sp. NPDC058497]|uniref:ParB/RepB/Spo0J family partition protein n=1 Tax=Nocardia sp. NPDC058497 TaxID=3346529 RepID=UPI00365A5E03
MTTVVTDSSDLDVADPPPVAVVEPSAEPAQAPPPGAIAQNLDPRALVITGNNVRPAPDLADHPKEVASIRQFGVRNPILAVRETDGSIHVIDGQVRTLAAIATGQNTVPVWVSEVDPSIGDRERQIERILTQINLNDRRIELTDSARAAGVALMLDLGASVTRITEGLQASDRSRIRKAGTIARSDTARRLLDDGQLSLDQLETIAGYETLGDTDAVEALTSVTRYQFDYQARLIADGRQTRRDRLRAALPYAAFGFGVLTDLPDIGTDLIPDGELLTGDGLPVSETDIYVDARLWRVFVDLVDDAELLDETTGELVDPATVDWDTRDLGPDAEPVQGKRSAHGLSTRDAWMPTYYLPAAALAESGLRRVDPVSDDVGTQAGGEADQQAEREQQQAERDQERAKRARVIELNKRGVAAKARRIDFLTQLLSARTAPAGAAELVAVSLTREPGLLGWPAADLARDLVGADTADDLIGKAVAATPGRAWVLVLALVLAAHEARLDKDSWRRPNGAAARYLHFLAEAARKLAKTNGSEEFRLVDVELATAGDIDYLDIDLDNPHTDPVITEPADIEDQDLPVAA